MNTYESKNGRRVVVKSFKDVLHMPEGKGEPVVEFRRVRASGKTVISVPALPPAMVAKKPLPTTVWPKENAPASPAEQEAAQVIKPTSIITAVK